MMKVDEWKWVWEGGGWANEWVYRNAASTYENRIRVREDFSGFKVKVWNWPSPSGWQDIGVVPTLEEAKAVGLIAKAAHEF
jgi:hypothetical protein